MAGWGWKPLLRLMRQPQMPHVQICSERKGICVRISSPISTYQRDPAELKPRPALCLNHLRIVAAGANVGGSVTFLRGLVGAPEDDRNTEKEVSLKELAIVPGEGAWTSVACTNRIMFMIHMSQAT